MNRVYTVCNPISCFRAQFCIVTPNRSIFRTVTVIMQGVPIRVFMVSGASGQESANVNEVGLQEQSSR